MRADEQTRDAVLDVLIRMWTAYEEQDLEEMLAAYGPEDELTCFGTGSDEVYIGTDSIRAGLERDFAQSAGASLTMLQPKVWCRGEVAWVAAGCRACIQTGTSEVCINGRFTAVLERLEEGWKVVQSHLSVPADFQEEGRSFPER